MELENKTSLSIYRQCKETIQEEEIYDNYPSSATLFKARSNTLQLSDRNRHTNGQSVNCVRLSWKILTILCCGAPSLQHLRQRAVELQQPYQEEEDYIIGRFLYEEARLKEKKEILNQMWNKRKKALEERKLQNEYYKKEISYRTSTR